MITRSKSKWQDKRDTLVHLTKSSSPGIGFPDSFRVPGDPRARLLSILQEKKIRASHIRHMLFLQPTPIAVAFSEAMPSTIQMLTTRYSPYGIHVHKFHAFSNGGGPCWYLNNEVFKSFTNDNSVRARELDDECKFLLTPLAPAWQDEVRFHNGVPCDWSHEREWRVPEDFNLPFVNGNPDFEVLLPDDEAVEWLVHQTLEFDVGSCTRLISELE